MKKTTKTVKTPKAPKAKKSTKKQLKPSFADVLKEVLNMNLVQKESLKSNKSHQDTPNDELNSLYIEATPESPDEPEIKIEKKELPFKLEIKETLPSKPLTYKERLEAIKARLNHK